MLHDLGLKYETDKATYHNFLNTYEKYISKEKVQKFLEIGIHKGASIRMWREFFDEQVQIEGWDINVPYLINGCHLKVVDQNDDKAMLRNIQGIYDVILDDGAHTTRSQELTFSNLFEFSRIYIIEDLHAPWCGMEYTIGYDTPTLAKLLEINKKGWLTKYATKDQKDYINLNAKIAEIYFNQKSPKYILLRLLLKISIILETLGFNKLNSLFLRNIVFKFRVDSITAVIINKANNF